jgi:hypothetical protein
VIAAVYARKSTEQTGVADEAKSVARQVEHARAYAIRKGWALDEAHVYTDDGISGAEFVKCPGFLRLMNALKPRPPFQVLVMSEESRLGRRAVESAVGRRNRAAVGPLSGAGAAGHAAGHHRAPRHGPCAQRPGARAVSRRGVRGVPPSASSSGLVCRGPGGRAP